MLRACGYKAELLESVAKEAIEEGLRHVNNDVCYPAITVIGQLLHALQSGRYDRGKVAVILSQTGGGCRATNYIGFLHKALRECGLDDIPVISFNLSDLNRNPGFRVNGAMLLRSVLALFCGDALMRMLYRTRPYEVEKGSADALAARWASLLNTDIHDGAVMSTYRHIRQAVKDFDELPLRDGPRRPQVGLVGEILLKYHPDANNNANTLSGGNQQRIVLAKWLATNPDVLILNGPTVGVDIGSKHDIHAILQKLARENGMGVIIISDDLPEVLQNCSRVLVLKDGKIVHEASTDGLTEKEILDHMM